MKRDGVTFRGTRDGVLVVLDEEIGFEALKQRLAERLEESGSFFQGSRVILDTGSRTLGPAELVDLEEMMSERFGVHLEKVVHGHSASRPAEVEYVSAPAPKQAVEEAESRQTLLIRRTLRSGQRIGYDGNVVVLGDANPGSEIVATGDIIVVGSLRGVAHAGASGDEGAVVAALRLAPTQLRIAGRIARPPEEISNPGRPEMARLSDGGIIVEAMSWVAGG
ncbi:MAG: septum site-determining protein MinC [Ignavibacteriales bacterium]